MKHKYLIILFFICTFISKSIAQERITVQGKVVSKTRDLEDIYIENVSSRKSTTTEKGGYFKLEMQPNDTLIFASVNLNGIRYVVKETDFSKKLLFIPMQATENTLDELIIERKITSETLGLAPKKKYTPAEKRLHTATSSSGGIIAIDAVVNALSGRTAMLKKALEYERESILVKRIINTFDEDYYIKELHIPKINIEGFGYYLSEDTNVVKALDMKNFSQLKFMMSEKAVEYIEIIKLLQ